MIDHDQPAPRRSGNAVLAANDRFDIRRIGHADKNNIALRGNFAGESGKAAPWADQTRCLGFRPGINDQRVSGLQQPCLPLGAPMMPRPMNPIRVSICRICAAR